MKLPKYFLILILCSCLGLSSCVNINKTAEQRLKELHDEYNVDLETIDFYVQDTKVNDSVDIRVTPSRPIQNGDQSKNMLFTVWRQIAAEHCESGYSGKPETTIIAVQSKGHRNMAMKILLKYVEGTAVCSPQQE